MAIANLAMRALDNFAKRFFTEGKSRNGVRWIYVWLYLAYFFFWYIILLCCPHVEMPMMDTHD